MKSVVVITDAPRVNYMHNFVKLPYYFGSQRYFERPDVKAIRETVFRSLNDLNEKTKFTEKFRNKKVLIKPNLVGVMFKCGYALDYIPQTTDPRVFEAVIFYLKELGCDITIIESAGKGIATSQSFINIGLDRVAKYYGAGLIAMEEQPLDHYYVPKAKVQKDVYLPRVLSQVISGEAKYVSVPKMKTNLYTGVTLGFKNAMGTLSGNMRYRNHSWQINDKLVDLLYLFKPDLTVVDGIIGGEGLTPAPVDPVKVGKIITGTNSVEVDRVVTRMMGIDPEKLRLTVAAEERGFGDHDTEVIGEATVKSFRPADCSFISTRFRKNWPNVHYYVGHTNSRVPEIKDIHAVTPDIVDEIENGCRGGCLSTMCFYMEMVNKAKHPPNREKVKFGCIIGDGCLVHGKRYWFDADGNPYDVEALKIEAINLNHMVGCGACSKEAYPACDLTCTGCHNVGEYIPILMKASGVPLPMLSAANDQLLDELVGMFRRWLAVRKVLKAGDIVEIPFDAKDDSIHPIPALSEEEMQKDWIFVPMPKLTKAEIRENLRKNRIVWIG